MEKLKFLFVILTAITAWGCPIMQLNVNNYQTFCQMAPPKAVKHYALPCTDPICRKHFIDCESLSGVQILPCLPGLASHTEGKVCYWQVSISIRSEACGDPGIDRSDRPCGTASIKVDGVERSLMQRGHNVVVLNYQTGDFLQSAYFDTHGSTTAAANFKNYVNSIPNESIVIVSVQDEAGKEQTADSKEALEMLGASVGGIAYRESFALIGYKGATSVSWITEVRHPNSFGPSEITNVSISLG